MNIPSLFLALLLQVPVGPTSSEQAGAGPGEIFRRASPSVVLIEMRNSDGEPTARGTGFVVQPEGTIITCLHVLQCAASGTVKLANGDVYEIRNILAIDKLRDLAIISIPAVDLPVLTMGRSSTVTVGQPVYTISNVLGTLQNTLAQGIVSGRRQLDGYEIFQVSTTVSEGSSGAPLLDEQGNVIGVVSARIPGEASLNFAIPIDYARGMLAFPKPIPLESLCTADVRLRKDPFTFFREKIDKWTVVDAKAQLGSPIDDTEVQEARTLLFQDPTENLGGFFLMFDKSTRLLKSVIILPASPMRFDQARRAFSKTCRAAKRLDKNGSIDFEDCRLALLQNNDKNLLGILIYK